MNLLAFRNVLLDYDGVIADIKSSALNAFNHTIELVMGIPNEKKALYEYQNPLYCNYQVAFERYFEYCRTLKVVPKCSCQEACDAFWHKYVSLDRIAPLLPGAIEAMEQLWGLVACQGGRCACITNRTDTRDIRTVSDRIGPFIDLLVTLG